MTGIYKIECIPTGVVYIGSTSVCFKLRFRKHKQRLRHNYHENDYLQKAWNKYGEHNFVFEPIEIVNNLSQVKKIEKKWLNKYFTKGKDFCFNLSDHTSGGNTLKTEAIKQKHSEALKRSYTPELLEKRRLFGIQNGETMSKRLGIARKTKKWKKNHLRAVRKLAKRKNWLEKTIARNKANGRPVKTNKGETFESVSEAARQTGAYSSNIRLSIRGLIKSSMGRKWYYA